MQVTTHKHLDDMKLELDALADSVSFWRLRRNQEMYQSFKAKYEAALVQYEEAQKQLNAN